MAIAFALIAQAVIAVVATRVIAMQDLGTAVAGALVLWTVALVVVMVANGAASGRVERGAAR